MFFPADLLACAKHKFLDETLIGEIHLKSLKACSAGASHQSFSTFIPRYEAVQGELSITSTLVVTAILPRLLQGDWRLHGLGTKSWEAEGPLEI
jgi:hypothetical protein